MGLKYRYSCEVMWIAGLSYTITYDTFGQLGRLNDNAVFAYLMTDIRF